jgi:hypothetical protein
MGSDLIFIYMAGRLPSTPRCIKRHKWLGQECLFDVSGKYMNCSLYPQQHAGTHLVLYIISKCHNKNVGIFRFFLVF